MKVVAVNGKARKEIGKRATKAVRREGMIPCVLYGGEEIIHFSTTENDVKDLIYTPDFRVADVEIDGTKHRCILKEAQWHPVTDEILHIDFLALTEKQPVKVELPVRFTGASPGVKNGGRLIQNVRRIKVKALPKNLVDELLLDISDMEMGDSIRVRDLEDNQDLEILNAPGLPIAIVQVPRALRSATTAEVAGEGEELPEGEEAAEGEEEAATEE